MIGMWYGTENRMNDGARPRLYDKPLCVQPHPNHIEKRPLKDEDISLTVTIIVHDIEGLALLLPLLALLPLVLVEV